VGETQQERDNNLTNTVIQTQLTKGLEGVNEIDNIVIAYEPVWAIGTGNNATAEQAEEVHKYIKDLMHNMYNISPIVIYGGSVNPDNCAELLKMPSIDGALPGGASLDPNKFAQIIKAQLQ